MVWRSRGGNVCGRFALSQTSRNVKNGLSTLSMILELSPVMMRFLRVAIERGPVEREDWMSPVPIQRDCAEAHELQSFR
jgi:hypothetical protein